MHRAAARCSRPPQQNKLLDRNTHMHTRFDEEEAAGNALMPPGATVNGRAKSDHQMKASQIDELEKALGLREANGSPIAHSAAPSRENHVPP